MMALFYCGSVLIFCSALVLTNAVIQCHDGYSCMSTNVTGTSENIECYGSYSCYNSVITGQGSSTKIECNGLFSCKNGIIEQSTSNYVYCQGEGSCESSIIKSPTSVSSRIYCYGYRSCADITSTNSSPIPLYSYFYGTKSAQNATLASGSGQYARFYFYGEYAGDGATIICDTACYIYCMNTGCSNLTVSCKNGDGTCTTSVSCYSPINSDICTSSENINVESWIPNIFQMDIFNPSSEYNSMDLCTSNETNALSCDESYECASETLDTSQNNSGSGHYLSPICCCGHYSCSNAYNITSKISLSTMTLTTTTAPGTIFDELFSSDSSTSTTKSQNNEDDVTIRCDGSFGCSNIDYITSITNGGNLYFTGYYSLNGQSSDSIVKATTLDNYNNENATSNVYCSGMRSCYYGTFKYGRNLFSIAYYGAYGSTIYEFTNVYCIGYYSCYSIQVDSIDTLIAFGYAAAYYHTANNVRNKVIGFGYYSTVRATLTGDPSYSPYVECVGTYCCYYCTISMFKRISATGNYAMQNGIIYNNENGFDNAATQLNCTGYQACKLSTIRGVASISVNGGNSLESATIYSEIYNGGTMEINVNDDNTISWYLYCNVSDFCIINCLSDAACTNLYGNCDGTCKIDCNSDIGFDCPAIGQLSGNVYFVPSPMPTAIPSQDPSEHPSDRPTAVPTMASNEPSESPTDRPTNNPSKNPTSNPSNKPSTEPSSNPTIDPTTNPSDKPINDPTRQPTAMILSSEVTTTRIRTTLSSSMVSTQSLSLPPEAESTATTKSSDSNTESLEQTLQTDEGQAETSNNSKSSQGDSIITIMIIIGVSAVVIVPVVICGLIWIRKRKAQEAFDKKLKVMETTRMEANSRISMQEHVTKGGPEPNDTIALPASSNHTNLVNLREGSPDIDGPSFENLNHFNYNDDHSPNNIVRPSTIKLAIVDSSSQPPTSSKYISDVTPGNFMNEEDNDAKEGELQGNETMNVNNAIENEDNNEDDTSDSSEAEMNELRNEIAAQTLMNQDVNNVMTTPGGDIAAAGARIPYGSMSSVNSDDQVLNDGAFGSYDASPDRGRVRLASDSGNALNNGDFGSIDMSHIDNAFMNDNDNNNQLAKSKNFSSHLSDNLVGIELLENDIVKEMEFDKKEPNAITRGGNQTAGGEEYL